MSPGRHRDSPLTASSAKPVFSTPHAIARFSPPRSVALSKTSRPCSWAATAMTWSRSPATRSPAAFPSSSSSSPTAWRPSSTAPAKAARKSSVSSRRAVLSTLPAPQRCRWLNQSSVTRNASFPVRSSATRNTASAATSWASPASWAAMASSASSKLNWTRMRRRCSRRRLITSKSS